MATSSFVRKIEITGKEAVDMIVNALTSDVSVKKDACKINEFLAENSRRSSASLKRFATAVKKA